MTQTPGTKAAAGRTAAFKNPAYLQSSLTLLLFFGSWGIWWSFFQIWLTNEETGLGLNGAQVGTIYSINSVGTLVLMFLYGTLQDRLGISKKLAIFTAAIQALVGPFMVFLYQPLLENSFMIGVVLGSIVLSAGFMAAVGLLEALAERFSRRFGFEYGQARMWGSFGYALVALMAGFLFNINPSLNFWVGSGFGVVLLLILIFWKLPARDVDGMPTQVAKMVTDAEGNQVAVSEKETQPGLGEMFSLLKMRNLWLIIVFVLFSWTFYTVFDQQMFPDFYTGLFDTRAQGQEVYGMLNAAQVFLEAAMMGLVPILMRKIGVRNTLMLGVLVMFLRITGCAVFDSPVIISIVKMFHAPEVALFILPVFRYFTLHFNPALSATLYMVGFQISAQVGNVVLSPGLGAIRDNIGYQPTFLLIAGMVAAAGIYGFFVLKRDDQDVLGDPYYTDRQLRAQATEETGSVSTTPQQH